MELSRKQGVWLKDVFVYAAGEMIAQQKQNSNAADEVRWNYRNPITGSQRGAVNTELDPFGVDAGLSEPQPDAPIIAESGVMNPGRYSDAFDGRMGCTLDGAPASCEQVYSLLGSGAAAQCPNNDCGSRTGTYIGLDGSRTSFLTGGFRAGADGSSGFGVPADIWRRYVLDSMVWATIQAIRSGGGAGGLANSFRNPNSRIFAGTWEVTIKAEDYEVDTSGLESLILSSLQPQSLQRRDSLPDYARSVYQGKIGEQLTRCINKVFSKVITGRNGKTASGANLLKEQTTRNAPKVDDKSFTMFVLGGGTGPLAAGRSFYGDEKRFGPNGTLYIANNLPPQVDPNTGNVISTVFEQYQRTYVHELGNLLSRKISPDGNARTFGTTPGIAGLLGTKPDDDTGVQLENCVFGNVIP